MRRSDAIDKIDRLVNEVEKVIVGQRRNVNMIVCALLADGHILLEGVPGLAKTLMVSAIGKAIGGKFKRIQMVPDMLPSDIIGNYVYMDNQCSLQHGPLHEANFVLSDEINRCPPRTQAALLEAMQERQITVLGRETFKLDDPFMVLATMNPIEQEGTYNLPEAQVDRFLLKIVVDYISTGDEKKMVQNTALDQRDKTQAITKIAEIEDIITIRQDIKKTVRVEDSAIEYIISLVNETRKPTGWDEDKALKVVKLGASPRAIFALRDMARVRAYLDDRDYVLPEDIMFALAEVLRHRIFLEFRASARGWTPDKIIEKTLERVKPA